MSQEAPFLSARDWALRAQCTGLNDLFFSQRAEDIRRAKRICNRECPVKAECLAWVLQQGEVEGVWAGTTLRERRPLRKEMRCE